MVGFISIFVPAFLAVGIYEKIEKKDLTRKQIIFYYLSFLLAMLFFNELILTYLSYSGESILSSNAFTNAFTVKYLGISMVEMFVFPYIFVLIKRNIEIKLEMEKEHEKKRNR